ncbi:MAG: LapA family protein [Burkholderiales bacterium]|nr:LapA family protein [Burkholderiales bacterium]
MKQVAWLFKWILKAAIFFTLFAFALNNQHDATVRFFFGQQWTAPLVLVVLCAFAAGLVIGVLGMVPRWWKQRRAAAHALQAAHDAAPLDTARNPDAHGT